MRRQRRISGAMNAAKAEVLSSKVRRSRARTVTTTIIMMARSITGRPFTADGIIVHIPTMPDIIRIAGAEALAGTVGAVGTAVAAAGMAAATDIASAVTGVGDDPLRRDHLT